MKRIFLLDNASLDPASPEQDFFKDIRFWGTEMLRFRDIFISLRGFFSATQYLGI